MSYGNNEAQSFLRNVEALRLIVQPNVKGLRLITSSPFGLLKGDLFLSMPNSIFLGFSPWLSCNLV